MGTDFLLFLIWLHLCLRHKFVVCSNTVITYVRIILLMASPYHCSTNCFRWGTVTDQAHRGSYISQISVMKHIIFFRGSAKVAGVCVIDYCVIGSKNSTSKSCKKLMMLIFLLQKGDTLNSLLFDLFEVTRCLFVTQNCSEDKRLRSGCLKSTSTLNSQYDK